MRSVLWLMLSLAGCQFQVAAAGGSSGPDLAPADTTGTTEAAEDLARPAQSIADLAMMKPVGPTPVAAMDMAPPPPKPGPLVGAACKTTAECGGDGLVCVDQVGVGSSKVQFPGGHCTRDCTNTACPSDSMCAREGGTFNLCMAKCTPGAVTGCRDGYRCCTADSVCAPTNSCD